MSTRKKKTEEFKYDFGSTKSALLNFSTNRKVAEEKEDKNKLYLQIVPLLALEKMRNGTAEGLDWANVQLRLHVGDYMVRVAEKIYDGFTEEDIVSFKNIINDGIDALESVMRRKLKVGGKVFCTNVLEHDMIVTAFDLTDEILDLIQDLHGKAAVVQIYGDTKAFLEKSRIQKTA